MSTNSTWATIWPVISFAAGLAATQTLEWTKARYQAKQSKEARRNAVLDQRHQYELGTLTATLSGLSQLIKLVAMVQEEAASRDPYDPNAVPAELDVQVADAVSGLQTQAAVVFDDTLRTELESMIRKAIAAITARTEERAKGRMNAYRDAHHAAVENVGARIRTLYGELLLAADRA